MSQPGYCCFYRWILALTFKSDWEKLQKKRTHSAVKLSELSRCLWLARNLILLTERHLLTSSAWLKNKFYISVDLFAWLHNIKQKLTASFLSIFLNPPRQIESNSPLVSWVIAMFQTPFKWFLIWHKNCIVKLTPDFIKDALKFKYLDLSYNRIQHTEKSSRMTWYRWMCCCWGKKQVPVQLQYYLVHHVTQPDHSDHSPVGQWC